MPQPACNHRRSSKWSLSNWLQSSSSKMSKSEFSCGAGGKGSAFATEAPGVAAGARVPPLTGELPYAGGKAKKKKKAKVKKHNKD